jgi:hypothetical protein
VEDLKQLNVGPPPDLRFGYTPKDLNNWYDSLGMTGRDAYKRMYQWDLVPFMQTYAVVLGSLLLQAAKRAGVNPKVAMIFFPVTMGFDFLETVIPAVGCDIYPQRLPHYLILVAVGANVSKWISFITGMVLLTVLWLYSQVRTKHPAPHRD